MKRFLIIVICIVLLFAMVDYLYFNKGFYIDFNPGGKVTTDSVVKGKEILFNQGDGLKPFEIKGVDMGSGIPGHWATDYAIDKDTYLRWFREIREMGANTLRVYTVQGPEFYEAFYSYNKDNDDPLYLLQGVWVNDYAQNSHIDAYNSDFADTFMEDCKIMVDVIHGNRKINLSGNGAAGSGSYRNDVSPWVIGYILGVEWEDVTVAYTNETYKDDSKHNSYEGKYMYTSGDATPFEAMLARVGDSTVSYESKRYKEQRVLAFSNWPITDPFEYPHDITEYFRKCTCVDVEHIKCKDEFLAGQFASYHIYPYYPDYLDTIEDWNQYGISRNDFVDEKGVTNTYRAYLTIVNKYHSMPVVVSEFGVSSGRGMAQRDRNTGRNQGNMSEKEQGNALVQCYKDIKAAGCAGSCIFSWQDEWFKRTWNTMYAVDLKRTPLWSDYQTNEQYFGLLSFDPGKEKSICYVDGDDSEWQDGDIVTENGDMNLSLKYDEKFIYFLIQKPDLELDKDVIYIPFDITSKSGTVFAKNQNLTFNRPVDFLLIVDGKNNSRMLVQEYYESLRSTYSENYYKFNVYHREHLPDKDSPAFVRINMILQTATVLLTKEINAPAEVYETGVLTYGNANPDSSDFNSLADFMAGDGFIEIKLPWQLLNFYDPSEMMVHDDYYNGNYGVKPLHIEEMYLGIAEGDNNKSRIRLDKFPLKGWGHKITYHERLKSSYYMMQELWAK